MRKILAKLTLIAGAALLLGSATSAQAQCSSGYGVQSYSQQYYVPQQSSCGQSQYYDYGYRQPVVQQRAHPANCGCSTCRSQRAAYSRRSTSSRSYRTAVRPRIVVNPYIYARPSYTSGSCR